ncbi:MAG: hypothetical protein S4CHLAM37_02180 [Chlamydiia bacterium]|nr:hypothetical protein [Chlamydiia bacterium]
MSFKVTSQFLKGAQHVFQNYPEDHPYKALTSSMEIFVSQFKWPDSRHITRFPSRLEIKAGIRATVKEEAIRDQLLKGLDHFTPESIRGIEDGKAVDLSRYQIGNSPLDHKDPEENYGSHSICFFKRSDLAQSVPKDHFSLGAKNHAEDTPLHILARNGDIKTFNALYPPNSNKRVTLSIKRNTLGRTAFDEACLHNNTEMAKALFEFAKLRVIRNNILAKGDKLGNTALHHCVFHGNEELTDLILDHPYYDLPKLIELKNSDGETAFHIACQKGHVEIARKIQEAAPYSELYLDQSSEGCTPFHLACNQSQFNALELVFKDPKGRKAQVMIKDREGMTGLHHCADWNFYIGINYILCHLKEADKKEAVLAEDDYNNTPLHDACQFNHLGSAEMLCIGNDEFKLLQTRKLNIQRYTPLELASSHDDFNLLNAVLCEKIPNRYMQLFLLKDDSSTPMHTLCAHLSVDNFKYVTRDFTDSEIKILLTRVNELGSTPLHNAATNLELFVYLHKKYPTLMLTKYSEDGIKPMELYIELYQDEIKKTEPRLTTTCREDVSCLEGDDREGPEGGASREG